MSEDRKTILHMLAEGAINADEAERLLAALDKAPPGAAGAPKPAKPKYLRVQIDAQDSPQGPSTVNVRVPFQLLRAGVRLSSMIPPEAREKANAAMREKGVDFDINTLKPENLDALIDQLSELEVDIDGHGRHGAAKVRVFCE
jgi:hypothetical protein